MIRKIPLHEPKLKGNELRYLGECVKSSWLSSSGKFVRLFEKRIAKYTNSRFAIACLNGTAALQLSLHLAGVRVGDEVIAPTITFIAPINAIKYNGANPIFMDCDEFCNIDSDRTIEFIKSNTYFKNGYTFNKKTKNKIPALVVVHVYGNPVNLENLVPLCKKRNIKIIEDSSESLGSFYTRGKLRGKHTGVVGFLGCLSFNINKIITSGGGGIILTNSKKIALKAQYLADQAKDDPIRFIHNSVGYNFRLTNIHAAIGLAQFENIKKILNKKRRVHLEYLKHFKKNKNIKLMKPPKYSKSNAWLNVIKIENGKKFSLKKLLKKMLSNNIEARPIWKCNHLQKPFVKNETFRITKAVELAKNHLCIPSSFFLKRIEIAKISSLINE